MCKLTKNIHKVFFIATILLNLTISLTLSEERNCIQIDRNKDCSLYRVSIIELISEPQQFHQKKIRITGYVHLEFENSGLYLHKEDYTHLLTTNGVWINIFDGILNDKNINDIKKCYENIKFNDRYVIMEGIFNADVRGHMGMWKGMIGNISRFEPWPNN